MQGTVLSDGKILHKCKILVCKEPSGRIPNGETGIHLTNQSTDAPEIFSLETFGKKKERSHTHSITLLPLIAADMYFTSVPLVCQVLEIWQQCNVGMEAEERGERASISLSLLGLQHTTN